MEQKLKLESAYKHIAKKGFNIVITADNYEEALVDLVRSYNLTTTKLKMIIEKYFIEAVNNGPSENDILKYNARINHTFKSLKYDYPDLQELMNLDSEEYIKQNSFDEKTIDKINKEYQEFINTDKRTLLKEKIIKKYDKFNKNWEKLKRAKKGFNIIVKYPNDVEHINLFLLENDINMGTLQADINRFYRYRSNNPMPTEDERNIYEENINVNSARYKPIYNFDLIDELIKHGDEGSLLDFGLNTNVNYLKEKVQKFIDNSDDEDKKKLSQKYLDDLVEAINNKGGKNFKTTDYLINQKNHFLSQLTTAVENYIKSNDIFVKEYYKEESLSDILFKKYLGYLKESNKALYDEYVSEVKKRYQKALEDAITFGENIITGKDNNMPLDIIDYYNDFGNKYNIKLNEFENMTINAARNSNKVFSTMFGFEANFDDEKYNVSPEIKVAISNFSRPYLADRTRLTEENLKVYSCTINGVVLDDEYKNLIVQNLNEANIPLSYNTLYAGFKRILNGSILPKTKTM